MAAAKASQNRFESLSLFERKKILLIHFQIRFEGNLKIEISLRKGSARRKAFGNYIRRPRPCMAVVEEKFHR